MNLRSHSPRVSVIMPTYNRSEIIPRSIKSVLRQTNPDFELFIIDDASTDGTEEVVHSFEDPRIRYIRRSVNHLQLYHSSGELDNPRNDGLKQARGKYISYLDSDDMYRQDFLADMSDYLDRHPDVGLAYCDAYWHRHLPGETEMSTCNLSLDFGPKVMMHRNIIRTPTVMHRREVIAKVGFFNPIWVKCPHPGVPYVGIEDWDYWFRVSKHYKVKHYSALLAHKINNTSDHYNNVDFDPEFQVPSAESVLTEKPFGLWSHARVAEEFQELSQKFDNISGYLDPAEGYTLMLLAQSGTGKGEIVEIGSFLGLSTCWMAFGAKRGMREKVTAVDHFQGSPEHQKGREFESKHLLRDGSTYKKFEKNLKLMRLKSWVRPLVADSHEAARDWGRPIRLLFIDGDHSYESSKRDFQDWSGFIVPTGYLALHDVGVWEGVTKLYREILERHKDRYRLEHKVKTLRVLKKIEND